MEPRHPVERNEFLHQLGECETLLVRNADAINAAVGFDMEQGQHAGRDEFILDLAARDHDLMQLAAAAGFVATSKQKEVLRRLSRFAQFAGRYPVAKTPDKMLPDETLGRLDVGFFSPQEFRVATSLVDKVMRQVSGKKRNPLPRRRLPARFVVAES